ncbi:MAG: type VI secretion system baseplate subunit TssE [Polyangiaceae bacterium]|nr:type VI secretion system baseplate subunit TssE [Polyangiaceae bacterium]MCW5789239.1 type VI secretion system baseplate subunit TssE [Polyangiaceae bacterium]
MRGHTLLRRVQNPEYAVARRSVSEHEIRSSILEHLRLMCGTRMGSMLTCPDFGVMDPSDLVHAFPDATTLLARSLRVTIETYEPRLQNVRVRFVADEEVDLVLRFEVSAQIAHEGSKVPISFETALDATRQLSVR